MDAEVAIWLGELIGRAVVELEFAPGLTIEVDDDTSQWLQLIPEESPADGSLAGFLLNFPYRSWAGDPLEQLAEAGLMLPPGTQVVGWEDGAHAAIRLRPDVPLVGLAHFAGDILEKIVGASPEAELSVQVEYGF